MDRWRYSGKKWGWGWLGMVWLSASVMAQEPVAGEDTGEWVGDVNPAGRISGRFESDGDWIPVPMGSGGDIVYALVQDGSRIYAGGGFTTLGTQTVNRVAAWDGASWSPLGSGFGNSVRAMVLQGGKLYAGGDFTNAGGRAVNRVAMWNGSAWTNLGAGVDGRVYSLAHDGTNLYAGGYFTNAGGRVANRIAKWNGTTWTNLGAGLNYDVLSLVRGGNRLYAAGIFTSAGGVAAERVAMWNGSAWTNLGAGLGGQVNTLTHDGTNLYAGGYFTNSGSLAVARVAKWNGAAWTNLGTGVNSAPWSSLWSGGRLFMGGDITTAGGAPATNLAMWTGGAWTNLGGGPVGTPYALMADSQRVYAGGMKTWGFLMYSNFLSSWTYGTGVFPAFGPKQGGFRVTIRGTSLGNGSDVTNVTLCGVKATQIVSQSATQVVVTAGTAGQSSTGAVKVYSSHLGVTTSSNAFSYLNVSSFKLQAAPLTDKVMLRWPNPKQYGYENSTVQIREATNRYPAVLTDGALVYSGTNRMAVHSNVVSKQTHYYTIWTSQNGVTFVEPN